MDQSQAQLQTAATTIAGTMQNGSGSTTSKTAGSRVAVKALSQQCGVHAKYSDIWNNLLILTGPAPDVRSVATQFLARKPKELMEIYDERIKFMTYTNLIGNGLGWYIATLFKDDINIAIQRGEETISPRDDEELAYYARLFEDCDRAGTPLTNAMQDVFRALCVLGAQYTLIDLPKEVSLATNAAEQKIEPYLCLFDPQSVINLKRDRYGRLEWILFQSTVTETPFLQAPVTVRRWSFYDKQNFKIYEHRSTDEKQPNETEDMATLVDEGRHALADYSEYEDGPATGIVPVVEATVPVILWLGGRVYLQQINHLNLENAMSWNLYLSNLPVVVIKTEADVVTLEKNEAGAVVLRPNDSYEYAEPSGKSVEVAQTRLDRLREDIYRSMYLQAQGRSEAATPAAQSGISKEQDMAPSNDVINAFGEIMRQHISTIMKLIAAIRQDKDLSFEVQGLQHDEDSMSGELADAGTVATLNIQSDTFHKESHKMVARKYLRKLPQTTIETVCAEIDSAPGKSEMDQQEKDREDQQMESKMAASFKLVADTGADDADDEAAA
jgi:hypothetical protein